MIIDRGGWRRAAAAVSARPADTEADAGLPFRISTRNSTAMLIASNAPSKIAHNGSPPRRSAGGESINPGIDCR